MSVKKSITTDRGILQRAIKIWNIAVLSLIADAFLLVDKKQDSIPAWAFSSNFIIPILLTISFTIAFLPYFQRFISNFHIRYSKQKRVLLITVFLATLLLPFMEILLRLRIDGAVGIFVAFVILLLIGYQFIGFFKNLASYSMMPARNRFFHINRIDTINFILFILAILSARLLCIILSLLYSYNSLSDLYFIVIASAAILLLLILKPSHLRFYSICPTCRDIRSKALDGLLMCPGCSRKVFKI